MGVEFFLLAAFLAMVCWGFGDFLIQKSVRKIGALESLAFIGLIGAIGILPFILPSIYLIFSLQNLLVLLLLGVVTFIGAIFDFEALKKGKLSVIEVVIELELPITIILAFLLFNEGISVFQLLLIVPIFFGIILMAVESKHLKQLNIFKRLEKGVILGLCAAVGMGAINVLTGFSAREISPLMAIWVPWVVIAIVSFVIILQKGELGKTFKQVSKVKWLVIATGIVDTFAWLFYAFSVSSYNLGIITAITESYPAIAIILAVLINHERIGKHQWIGVGVTLVASVLLAVTLM